MRVARQYTGSAGKITNCQIGVFAAYVSRHGHAFVDRALYVPKAWASHPARRAAAHIPDTVEFATKPHLALNMIERAIAAGVPFAYVAADTVYGVGELEMALRRAGRGYVLWTRGLLTRRHRADGELAYFSTWCPAETPIGTLVAVEGHRWSIKDAFETAKNELGLDHNETRSWHGWHRHVSLVMLAFAILAVTRHHANAAAEQTSPRMSRTAARSSDGRSRRSAELPNAWPRTASTRRSSSPGQPGDALTRQPHNALT